MEEEIDTLLGASRILGINYSAVLHMTQFGVVNETAITEDLSNGLLYEWLEFIHDHTDSNTNDFEEAVINLFLEKTLKLTPLRRSKLTPFRRSKLTPLKKC